MAVEDEAWAGTPMTLDEIRDLNLSGADAAIIEYLRGVGFVRNRAQTLIGLIHLHQDGGNPYFNNRLARSGIPHQPENYADYR